ncbi:hypothetical protein N7G274_009231 [Stereocaulon virgatum]|uniref:Uncharacterized protein n=1 Tax=Stereocaulon virgatum TaxID=373712 RepID=A0ABR3ZZ33_9LECA
MDANLEASSTTWRHEQDPKPFGGFNFYGRRMTQGTSLATFTRSVLVQREGATKGREIWNRMSSLGYKDTKIEILFFAFLLFIPFSSSGVGFAGCRTASACTLP